MAISSVRRGTALFVGADARHERRELLGVEAVDARGVAAEHRGDLGLGQAAERLEHLLARRAATCLRDAGSRCPT